jgi:hypothetical protein
MYQRSLRYQGTLRDITFLRAENAKLQQDLLEAATEVESAKLKLQAVKNKKKLFSSKLARLEGGTDCYLSRIRTS